jgi:hypothetical protein
MVLGTETFQQVYRIRVPVPDLTPELQSVEKSHQICKMWKDLTSNISNEYQSFVGV